MHALIIDRQPLFTAALGRLLSGPPLAASVWTTTRTTEGFDTVQREGIQLVFCDVCSEPMAGREVAEALASLSHPVATILLGDLDDQDLLVSALASSAAGLFSKDSSFAEFLVGVEAVLSGHRAVGARVIRHLIDRLDQHTSRKPSAVRAAQLSPTELEILAMIGHAASIPSIAATRGISHKTVRNHLAKIYRKLELHGRTEAMLWATRMGLTGAAQ